MSPKIIILAGQDDVHADAVERELDSRGAGYARVDRGELVASGVEINGKSAMVGTADLHSASAIWCRRFPRMALPADMPEMWRKWCAQEFAHALLGALMRPRAHWVSDYFATQRAGYKVLQLHLARSVAGLNVPDYVVTSNVAAARAFVDAYRGEAVFKSLGPPSLADSETVATLYTNSAKRIGPEDWEGLELAPMIFQRRIDRVAEIRTTIVGEQIFAARIELADVEEVDTRKANLYALPHEPITLPDEVAAGCLKLLRALDLRFGAFDLLLDRDGRFHFLEINPNGQWYWIEELTGMPIARAMADELASHI